MLKNYLKAKLSSTFRMKNKKPAMSCLIIRFTRTERSVSLNQRAYIDSILRRYSMQDAKPVTTPTNVAEKLSKEMSPKTAEEAEWMENVPYQEAVLCLMYLTQCMHPNILFAVNLLSRTIGYIFLLRGGAVSWICKRQTTVSFSTCAAEYMAYSSVLTRTHFTVW